MQYSFQIIIRMALLVLFVMPLMANKSCGSAIDDAEKTSLSETDDTGTAGHSDKLPVLPEDPKEAEQILKSGGPEIISVPTGDK